MNEKQQKKKKSYKDFQNYVKCKENLKEQF